MKQKKLVKKIYSACIGHDKLLYQKLLKKELKKVFEKKEQGKLLAKPKYTLVR